jgi:chromate transporter
MSAPQPAASRSALREVALTFLRLGVTAFGGPAAHIALMQEELVERRHWLSREEFLDLIGAANVIPGPNSTEVAMHIGYVRARWQGLVVAGVCFIVPAALIVGVLAAIYVRFSALPATNVILATVSPVVIAIVLQAIWKLGATALRGPWTWTACGLAAAAAVLHVDPLAVLAVVAVVAYIASSVERRSPPGVAGFAFPLAMTVASASVPAVGLLPLFFFFLKVGSVLFGSGYVLVAFLRADLVERWGWLTDRQLLDAISIGQVTPGPVFTTATFIGYLIGGTAGAVLATVAIFLPAFFFVAISARLLARVRASPVLRTVLDGINAASLGLLVAVAWDLGRAAVVDGVTAAIAAGSLAALIWLRLNPTWLITGAAAVGCGLAWLRA